jgi:ribosomal protein S18 acetylase RimI-like enzyme
VEITIKDFIYHTMEHNGNKVQSNAHLQPYSDDYYEEYLNIYEDCFREMRTALELYPINAGDSREELQSKANDVFIYLENNVLIGSVVIYGNEIDDLIVAKEHQKKGYGLIILNFAIAKMQAENITPIILTVTDWNQDAIRLYLNNGFTITKTETIKCK